MQVITRDGLQNRWAGGVNRNLWPDLFRHRARPFPINKDGLQLVARLQGALNDHIPLGDEHAGHVTVRPFPNLTQDVITQALEHIDAGIGRIIDGNRTGQAHRASPGLGSGAIQRHVRPNDLLEQTKHFAVLGVPAGFRLRIDQFVVDDDIEHTCGASDQCEVIDDVLIVRQQI